jgi:hypothetical protein
MVERSLSISETALQPPLDVYGEYAMPKGLEESNDGTEAPFTDAPPLDPDDDDCEDTGAAVDAGTLSEVEGS